MNRCVLRLCPSDTSSVKAPGRGRINTIIWRSPEPCTNGAEGCEIGEGTTHYASSCMMARASVWSMINDLGSDIPLRRNGWRSSAG